MNILRSGAASAIALLMLTVAPGPLMSVAEDVVTTAGFGHILVPAALNAVGFYRRLGYHDGDLGEVTLGPATAPIRRMWKHPAESQPAVATS